MKTRERIYIPPAALKRIRRQADVTALRKALAACIECLERSCPEPGTYTQTTIDMAKRVLDRTGANP